MASILRQIVAGPRSRHPEADLDLCYVTDKSIPISRPTYLGRTVYIDSPADAGAVIATSGPSVAYPSLAYRNPLSDLVRFLDSRHGDQWCIFEFRAEGTCYPDEEVYGRIWHWPWPDHHPPPFGLIPRIMGSMRCWLIGEGGDSEETSKEDRGNRVAVVHCKAGKGRSGTIACSYLITHEGWSKADALQRFTQRRMRPGFGAGVSIPSQLRWVDYVERWARCGGRMYVEREVEILEVHVWGLREGVKIAVEGFVDNGRTIKVFHVFKKEERDDLPEREDARLKAEGKGSYADMVHEGLKRRKTKLGKILRSKTHHSTEPDDNTGQSETLAVPSGDSTPTSTTSSNDQSSFSRTNAEAGAQQTPSTSDVIYRPATSVRLPSSDINLAVERRSWAGRGWSTITSVAHVWFNCYFEGNGPENYQKTAEVNTAGAANKENDLAGSPWADSAGVFTISWDAMDGIKGSSRKGTRGFDKVAVVWKAVSEDETSSTAPDAEGRARKNSIVMPEPGPGDPIQKVDPADWRGVPQTDEDMGDNVDEGMARTLGLHRDHTAAGDIENEPLAEAEAAPKPDSPGDDEDGAEGVRRGLAPAQEEEAVPAKVETG